MELKKAFELQTQYGDFTGTVRVDENGYFCLNDFEKFFPHKRIDNWLRGDSVQELIEHVNFINPHIRGIIGKRGKGGATYAHELIAMDFAAWLSVEFKVKVYQAYLRGSQRKENWNLKRILAAENFKIMTKAVHDAHSPAKSFHYSNEATMINLIVLGSSEPGQRDSCTEEQLDDISWCEHLNAAYIDADMDFPTRRDLIKKLYLNRKQKLLEKTQPQ